MTTPKKSKTLLKVNPVSAEHWSSGKSANEVRQTKCVVQIIKASHLLASDAETGKSDPVCFLKFCPQYSAAPQWNNYTSPDSGILSTTVIHACTEPIWNSFHTFPLILESYQELLNASIHVIVRDEDIEDDGTKTYDDLGQAKIPIKESIKIAKIAQRHNKNAFLGAPVWYTLDKCPGMRKKDGKILVSISIHFEDEDTKQIQEEQGVKNIMELMSKYKIDANVNETAPPLSSIKPASFRRKKSNVALTPRVASPTRLYSDSSQTPILELPEETSMIINGDGEVTVNDDTDKENTAAEIKDPYVSSPQTNSNNLGVVESPKMTNEKVEEKYAAEDEDLEQAALIKSRVEEESKLILEAAVRNAKAEAELEAAKIISRAKAEIESAKKAAKRQIEMDAAVNRATLQIELNTHDQLNRLRKEAVDETNQIRSKVDVLSTSVNQGLESNRHEGDLYWDENDKIAGGNDLTSTDMNANDETATHASLESEERLIKPKIDNLKLPTSNETGNENLQTEPGTDLNETNLNNRSEDQEKVEASISKESEEKHIAEKHSTTKEEKNNSRTPKSKIPKLVGRSSSLSNVKRGRKSPPSGNEANLSKVKDDERKIEAKKRLQKAKKDFMKKQAEESNSGNLMSFIPSGGDESLPDENEYQPHIVDDDDSVASTTADEDDFSPRWHTSLPGQGNRPDTIRALREITQHREHMDRALAEMQRKSEEKFSIVEKQLSAFKKDNIDDDPKKYHNVGREYWSNFGSNDPSFDIVGNIDIILRKGNADDIGAMLDQYPAQETEVLPMATRVQLYDCIGTFLRSGKHKDSCLRWIAALLNNSKGENLVDSLPDYTCKSIVHSLVTLSSEPSNRGVLAARLESQMLQNLC